MKPLLLPLARENVRQFIVKLAERMRKGGGLQPRSRSLSSEQDGPPGTVIDPGTFPQPEAGCALNRDKKWEKRVEVSPGVELALVYVPNGSFAMGSLPEAKDEDSQPQHSVTIGRAFWIGKSEVTQAQWKAVMGKSPSAFKGDDLPVDNVSWNDSLAFVAAVNQRLGLDNDKGFRLPTEAEWEYACRAGTTSNFSFSDSKKNLAKYAWFDETSKKTTHAVGQFLPNPWGVYDMYGDVSEWCEDVWHSDYKGAPADGTAWGGNDEDRVHRGGHWDRSATRSKSSSRDHDEAKKGDKTIGLRVVLPALNPQTVLPTPTPSVTAVVPSESTKTEVGPGSPAVPAPEPLAQKSWPPPAQAASSDFVRPTNPATATGQSSAGSSAAPTVPAAGKAGEAESRVERTVPSQAPVSSVVESDAPNAPTSATFVVMNRSSQSVAAVKLTRWAKEGLGGDSSTTSMLSASIPVRQNATIGGIDPTDHGCVTIVRTEAKDDLWCMELSAAKTYAFTVVDGDRGSATLTVVNRSARPVMGVKMAGPDQTNLLSSAIPPGGQAVIRGILRTGLQLFFIDRGDGTATAWAATPKAGCSLTFVLRDAKSKK